MQLMDTSVRREAHPQPRERVRERVCVCVCERERERERGRERERKRENERVSDQGVTFGLLGAFHRSRRRSETSLLSSHFKSIPQTQIERRHCRI